MWSSIVGIAFVLGIWGTFALVDWIARRSVNRKLKKAYDDIGKLSS